MMILALLKKVFAPKPVSELEAYLNKQDLHTTADVEFYIRKFDERRAVLNRHIANGNMGRYYWDLHQY